MAACAVQLTQRLTNTFNGSTNYARSWTNYSYDSSGRLTDATANANDGAGTGSPGSPTLIVTHTDYLWNDSVSATGSGATGHYLLDFPAQRYVTDAAGDSGDLRTACALPV